MSLTTAEKWLERTAHRRAGDSRALYAIATAVLEELANRRGGLSPASMHLRITPPALPSDVDLAALAPYPPGNPVSLFVADLQALGAILHRVATGSDPAKGDPTSRDAWKGIDPRWHDLTARLLRARPGIPLQQLRDEVHALRPRGRPVLKSFFIAIVCVLIIGALAAVYLVRNQRAWSHLERDYQRGFTNLSHILSAALGDPAQRAVLPTNVQSIWTPPPPDQEQIRSAAPFHWPPLSPSAMSRVHRTQKQFDNALAALRDWQAAKLIADYAIRFGRDRYNFPQAARKLQQLADALSDPQSFTPQSFADAIEILPLMRSVDQSFSSLADKRKQMIPLKRYGVDFDEYITRRPTEPDSSSASEAVRFVDAFAQRALGTARSLNENFISSPSIASLDLSALAEEQGGRHLYRESDIQQWLDQLSTYQKLDPSIADLGAADAQLDRAGEFLTELSRAGSDAAVLTQLQAAVKQARDAVAAEQASISAIRLIAKNRPDIIARKKQAGDLATGALDKVGDARENSLRGDLKIVGALRQRGAIARSAAISARWDQDRAAIPTDIELRRLYLRDLKDFVAKTQATHDRYVSIAKSFDDLPGAYARQTAFPPPATLAHLQSAGRSFRENLLQAAFVSPDVDAALIDAKAKLSGWSDSRDHLIADAAKLFAALNESRALTEPLDSGTIDSLAGSVAQNPIFNSIAGDLKPLLGRVDTLRSISVADSVGGLTLLTRNLDRAAAPEVVPAVWERLAFIRPQLADFKVEIALLADLHAADLRMKYAARWQAISANTRSRWKTYFNAARADPATADDVLDHAADFSVDLNDDPTMRFNALIRQLRHLTNDPPATEPPDADVRQLLTQIKHAAAAPEIAGAAARFTRDIDAQILKKEAESESLRLTGPPAPWTQDKAPPFDTPLRIHFVWPNRETNRPHELEFRRLPMGDHYVYLCTTEVSVGLFNDWAANRVQAQVVPKFWSDFKFDAHVPTADPTDEQRQGPRSWEWADAHMNSIRPPATWLKAPDRTDKESNFTFRDYPPALGDNGNPRLLNSAAGGQPSWDGPMQYVPAKAAARFAHVLGCRIPSPEEWTAASKLTGPLDPNAWNLRDAAFNTQQQHVDDEARRPHDSVVDSTILRPDAQIFGATIDAPKATPDSTWPSSDGVLWFRQVGADDHPFHNLIGNVGEFAVTDPQHAFDQNLSDAAVVSAMVVAAKSNRLAVIGGSALSPRTIDPAQPQPLASILQTFSDIGFRLAFTAPKESLFALLMKADAVKHGVYQLIP